MTKKQKNESSICSMQSGITVWNCFIHICHSSQRPFGNNFPLKRLSFS